MITLKALRTLNAIEAGTLDSSGLQARLADPGHLAEFYSLLSTKGQTRRMAASALTMETIAFSEKAHKAIFETATNHNTTAAQAVADSPIAMAKMAMCLEALTVVIENDISWNIFIESPYYESNIKTIVALFAGIDPSLYSSIEEMIEDPAATYEIAGNDFAMTALVNSTVAMTKVVNTFTAMDDISANTSAITIVANNNASMNLVAQSSIAMSAVTDESRSIVVGIPSALKIMASYPVLWKSLMKTSETLAINIYGMIIVLTEIDPTVFTTVEQIFGNEVTMSKVASNRAVIVAVMNEPSALDLMVTSYKFSVILSNPISMGLFTADAQIMSDLIGSSSFPDLLNSTLAKEAIFASPSLIATMTTLGSDSLQTLKDLSIDLTGPTPDTKIGLFQDLGLPGNIILLTARIGSITAAKVDNYFKGDGQSTATFACPGTHAASEYPIINLPFTNIQWDINSIAATAAARITITYVSF
jgi:hypothetical protein